MTVVELEKELKENKLNSIYLLFWGRNISFRELFEKNKENFWRNIAWNKLYTN